LDRYLAYRERVHTTHAAGRTDGLEHRLALLHRIRVEIFGASDAAILFGEEEQVQAVDLQRRAVMRDTTLDAEERERRLYEIEQELPPAIRAARAESVAPLHLMQDEQALRAANGTEEEIRALRAQRFGADAAARLAALDREQAAWRQRVENYRSARRAIEADPMLSTSARATALEALLADRFTAQERVRVEALVE
jgi:lipase chaperone LimK